MTAASLERGPTPDRHTVYAVEIARRAGRRGEHLLGWDETSAEPHETAYYAWLALSADRAVLVDCGIRPGTALPGPGWRFVESVSDVLAGAGVAADEIDTVVLTHLHYDHAGGLRSFPNARVVLQAAELEYWSGPAARRNAREAWLVAPDDLAHVRHLHSRGALRLVSGDIEVTPGLTAHLVGGHTAGMQIVRVNTAQGPVVIASDASHFYENLETHRPGTIVHDLPSVFSAFDRIGELASGGIVLPGHDPAVSERFRRESDRLPEGLIRGGVTSTPS